jgi:alpha-beta hydrolase superfamily lysophospholipase
MAMLYGRLAKTVTSDGIELQGFWINKNRDIAVLHTHGSAADFYTQKFLEVIGEKLTNREVSYLTANNRGHDVYAYLRQYKDGKVKWTQIGGGFERFEDCILDIKAWIDFLEEQGVKKVILQGHSLCQKLVYYQYVKPDPRVIGHIYLSPGNDAGLMYSTLGEEKYRKTNVTIREMVEQGREKEMLPKELAVVCPMAAIAYYGYLTEESTGNIFPYHNPKSQKWQALSSIREPLLVIFGEADNLIKPSVEKATRLFKEKAASSRDLDVRIVKNANHSFIGYEDEVAEIVTEWVERNLRE